MQATALQKIKQRMREHGVSYKIEELCLDEIRLVLLTQQVSSLIESCNRVEHLSLCNCHLSSLLHLPALPNLAALQLANNHLESEHLEPLMKYSKLYSLTLDSNCISDFTWVRFFKRTRLAELSLRDNSIAAEADYREKVYKLMGADLEVLDGVDRQGNTVEQCSSVEGSSSSMSGSEMSSESESVEAQAEAQDSLQKKIKGEQQ